MGLKLYGRSDCHLCEEMARELRLLGIDFEEIDVDTTSSLKEKYGKRVPVLTVATGTEICHYRLDEAALKLVVASITRH